MAEPDLTSHFNRHLDFLTVTIRRPDFEHVFDAEERKALLCIAEDSESKPDDGDLLTRGMENHKGAARRLCELGLAGIRWQSLSLGNFGLRPTSLGLRVAGEIRRVQAAEGMDRPADEAPGTRRYALMLFAAGKVPGPVRRTYPENGRRLHGDGGGFPLVGVLHLLDDGHTWYMPFFGSSGNELDALARGVASNYAHRHGEAAVLDTYWDSSATLADPSYRPDLSWKSTPPAGEGESNLLRMATILVARTDPRDILPPAEPLPAPMGMGKWRAVARDQYGKVIGRPLEGDDRDMLPYDLRTLILRERSDCFIGDLAIDESVPRYTYRFDMGPEAPEKVVDVDIDQESYLLALQESFDAADNFPPDPDPGMRDALVALGLASWGEKGPGLTDLGRAVVAAIRGKPGPEGGDDGEEEEAKAAALMGVLAEARVCDLGGAPRRRSMAEVAAWEASQRNVPAEGRRVTNPEGFGAFLDESAEQLARTWRQRGGESLGEREAGALRQLLSDFFHDKFDG